MNAYYDPAPLTATAIRHRLASGSMTALDVLDHFAARIAVAEPAVRAWQALDLARVRCDVQSSFQGHASHPLGGIPVAVKDIIATEAYPTRFGSPIYREGVRGADAHCVAQVRAAGALVLGKTVTTEFAYFEPGETANPHDIRRTPGGSSSGSAAAVAAGMVPLAFGSQTAGSLIRPASYCGVFAIKPSHGQHSLSGVKAMAPSLDTLGWLANDADDLELMRAVLSGIPFEALPQVAPEALRLGICRTHEWPLMEADGARVFDAAVSRLATAAVAAVARELRLPAELDGLMTAQKTVQAYEAARSFWPEWSASRALMSPSLSELIETGLACSETDYRIAIELARQGVSMLDSLIDGLDALVVPSAPGEAPMGLAATGDPVFSRVWTLLGLPCVNVPGMRGPNGMPVGIQLVGRVGSERRLLAIAKCLHPILSTGD